MPKHVRTPLLAMVMVSVALLVMPVASSARARAHIDGVEKKVVHILNAVRRHYGLRRLSLAGGLSSAASAHSAQMARTGILTHGNWHARLARAAGSGTVGEVVGFVVGRPKAQAGRIVSAWMHSAPHRAVLLTGSYRRLGVGRSGSGGREFFTVDVAR